MSDERPGFTHYSSFISHHSFRQHLYLRNVPILLREIESVSDDEERIDREADVLRFEIDFAGGGFIEKRRGADHRGAATLNVAMHFAHREAAVDDVFDDQHRFAAHVELRFFENRHHAGRFFLTSVARDLNEIERDFATDRSHQVRTEKDAAFEDAERDHLRAGEIFFDFLTHFRNAFFDLRARD